MKYFTLLIAFFIFISSCSENKKNTLSDSNKSSDGVVEDMSNPESNLDESISNKGMIYSKTIKDIVYTSQILNGYEFYKKRSSIISKKDSLDLIKETVVVFEFRSINSKEGIWKNSSLQMSEQ